MTEACDFPEFHGAEFVALRAEILQIEGQIDRLMLVSIAAAAAVAAWLTTNNNFPSIFWLAPFLIFCMTFGFYYARYHSIWLMGRYIKLLEERYRQSSELGWEHFLDRYRPNMMSLWSERLTWAFLFASSLLFYLIRVFPSVKSLG